MGKRNKNKTKVKNENLEQIPKTRKANAEQLSEEELQDNKLQIEKGDETIAPLEISTTITNHNKICNMLKLVLKFYIEQSFFEENVVYPINRNILDVYKKSKCSLKRDPVLDETLKTEYRHTVTNNFKSKSYLTIFKKQREILDLMKQNSVILIHGEPESGKTTQVPQFILNEYMKTGNGSMCKIVSTQPYQKCVTAAYEKVAEERKSIFGKSDGIGYQIRFENHASRNNGSITFCTTGILMKRIANSSYLNQITHLIIDEIQERNVYTDLLLAFIKQIIATRKDLKLILMCTSVYNNKFSNYFHKCREINVSADLFPVNEYFLEDTLMLINFNNLTTNSKQENANEKYPEAVSHFVKQYEKSNQINAHLIITIITFINEKYQNGNILILIPDNLYSLQKILVNDTSMNLKTQSVNATAAQINDNCTNRKIFLTYHERFINLNNNNIMFVIDTGKIRLNFFDVITNMETVKNDWISKKTLQHRKNLAGRNDPGICFHLISQDAVQNLEEYPIPQIMLSDLEKIILEVKTFGIKNAKLFLRKCLSTPDNNSIDETIETFKINYILTDEEYLTPIGFHVSKLPLEFSVGKMVILGALFSCLDPILTVAACFSFPNIFIGKFRDIEKIKNQYYNETYQCEFLLIVHLLDKLKNSKQNETEFLKENFLRPTLLREINNTTKQLKIRLMEMNFLSRNFDDTLFNINSKNTKLIHALLSMALYPNVALVRNHTQYDFNTMSVQTVTEKKCYIVNHNSSLNGNLKTFCLSSPILMYRSSTEHRIQYLHETLFVTPLQALIFANHVKYATVNANECIINVIGSLKIHCSPSTCETIKKTQESFNTWLDYKLKTPACVNWKNESWDTSIMRAVIALLDHEEEVNHFLKPI